MSKLAYVGAAMPGLGLMLWFAVEQVVIGAIIVFSGVIIWVGDLLVNTSSNEYRKTVILSFLIFIIMGLLAIFSI